MESYGSFYVKYTSFASSNIDDFMGLLAKFCIAFPFGYTTNKANVLYFQHGLRTSITVTKRFHKNNIIN